MLQFKHVVTSLCNRHVEVMGSSISRSILGAEKQAVVFLCVNGSAWFFSSVPELTPAD